MAHADWLIMRNRADNPYHALDLAPRTSADWMLDRRPILRLAAIYGVFSLAIVAIAARLTYVQAWLTEQYAAEFSRTVERFEPIPSHDGRILAADGEVLAEDRLIFGLHVHYRWLEEPPDAAWLKGQALSRLDRAARRNPRLVAGEMERVLAMRSELWRNLARVTRLPTPTLARRRREIQRGVEHVYQHVDERRTARESAADEDAGPPASNLLDTAWRTIVSALTTPPAREAGAPLIIREQLDYHVIVSEIERETAFEIEAHPELYPGTRVAVTTRRVYPQGDVAPHVVGYRTAIDDAALAERAQQFPHGDPLDYQAGDRVGKTGLERYYERQLRGLRGLRKLVLNRRGEVQRTETVREPRFGHDLVLSINLPLQRSAEQLLDEVLAREHEDETNGKLLPIPPGGAIVAMDARTGSVLAAATAPRCDLRLLVNPSAEAWGRLLADPRKPLFHRAAEMALPPGSVFKVLSAIAFVESGRLDPGREFQCQGYLDDPDHYRCLIYRNFGATHGAITLVDALARSCNVYFFSAARRIGAAPLIEWATRFGFGLPTGIDLPGERSGTVPRSPETVASVQHSRGHRPIAGDVLQLAIGQGRLTTTPLQIVRMMSAVANGGKLTTPRLVDSTGPALIAASDAPENPVETSEPRPIPELSTRTLEWVRLGLAHVVADSQGTGFKTVRLKEVAIAGKTGTAEAGGGRPDHAWFAGYVPADKPRIAFVVVLENAGSGGHAAGPVARKFVQALLANGLLESRSVPAPSAN